MPCCFCPLAPDKNNAERAVFGHCEATEKDLKSNNHFLRPGRNNELGRFDELMPVWFQITGGVNSIFSHIFSLSGDHQPRFGRKDDLLISTRNIFLPTAV